MEVQIQEPRITGRQVGRSNQPASGAEEYFLRAVYIPLLDNILMDIKNRFSPDVLQCFGLRVFMPTATNAISSEELSAIVKPYIGLLGLHSQAVLNEYELWVTKWTREVQKESGVLPKSPLDALNQCDPDIYPGISKLLAVLSTLPVSAATAERSFSTLRRLKTWLRTTMTEERLNGLALLHIHQDINIDINKVIDRFAKNNRKLDFVI